MFYLHNFVRKKNFSLSQSTGSVLVFISFKVKLSESFKEVHPWTSNTKTKYRHKKFTVNNLKSVQRQIVAYWF